jgi:hypothetical protein
MSGSMQQLTAVSSVRVLESPSADQVSWQSGRVEKDDRDAAGYEMLFRSRSQETRPHLSIQHPMANRISVQNHGGAYADAQRSELAFFQDDEWVVEPIPEFAEYHDGSPSDADIAVYPWVPNDLVVGFLRKFAAAR